MALSALFGATLKVTAGYVVLSIFVSSAVGIISGWYPAQEGGAARPGGRVAGGMNIPIRVSPGETLAMALGAVWAHKFRSGLTILGIVIGITTVVTVASLLTGLRQGIVDFFQEFGPDNIFVARVSGDPSGQGARPKELKRRPLRPEYARISQRRGALD